MRRPAWLDALEFNSRAEWWRGPWLIDVEWINAHTLRVRVYRCGALLASEMTSDSTLAWGSEAMRALVERVTVIAIERARKTLTRLVASVRPKRTAKGASR